MTQQWVKLSRYITDQILICDLSVYNSSKTKPVTAEERTLITMKIWLQNKIKNGQTHNLITFQNSLKILLGQRASC